ALCPSFHPSSLSPPCPVDSPPLHDALPISPPPITLRRTSGTRPWRRNPLSIRLVSKNRNGNMKTSRPAQMPAHTASASSVSRVRSEEHTSELQSRFDLVCRLLLETKKTVPA